MPYHFVKIANIWYLKPETKQDIVDHYNIILKREYEEGFKDRKSSTHLYKNYFGPGEDYIYISSTQPHHGQKRLKCICLFGVCRGSRPHLNSKKKQ